MQDLTLSLLKPMPLFSTQFAFDTYEVYVQIVLRVSARALPFFLKAGLGQFNGVGTGPHPLSTSEVHTGKHC